MRTTSTARRLAATLGAAALIAALGAPAALAADADCDPLVTHAPTGSQGDAAAVAITSQTLSAEVGGWERVGWEAADDTTVTAVTVVREDGAEHRTDGDLQAGSAEGALELKFCGAAGADAAGGPLDADDEVAGATLAAVTGDASPLLATGLVGLLAGAAALGGRRHREVRR